MAQGAGVPCGPVQELGAVPEASTSVDIIVKDAPRDFKHKWLLFTELPLVLLRHMGTFVNTSVPQWAVLKAVRGTDRSTHSWALGTMTSMAVLAHGVKVALSPTARLDTAFYSAFASRVVCAMRHFRLPKEAFWTDTEPNLAKVLRQGPTPVSARPFITHRDVALLCDHCIAWAVESGPVLGPGLRDEVVQAVMSLLIANPVLASPMTPATTRAFASVVSMRDHSSLEHLLRYSGTEIPAAAFSHVTDVTKSNELRLPLDCFSDPGPHLLMDTTFAERLLSVGGTVQPSPAAAHFPEWIVRTGQLPMLRYLVRETGWAKLLAQDPGAFFGDKAQHFMARLAQAAMATQARGALSVEWEEEASKLIGAHFDSLSMLRLGPTSGSALPWRVSVAIPYEAHSPTPRDYAYKLAHHALRHGDIAHFRRQLQTIQEYNAKSTLRFETGHLWSGDERDLATVATACGNLAAIKAMDAARRACGFLEHGDSVVNEPARPGTLSYAFTQKFVAALPEFMDYYGTLNRHPLASAQVMTHIVNKAPLEFMVAIAKFLPDLRWKSHMPPPLDMDRVNVPCLCILLRMVPSTPLQISAVPNPDWWRFFSQLSLRLSHFEQEMVIHALGQSIWKLKPGEWIVQHSIPRGPLAFHVLDMNDLSDVLVTVLQRPEYNTDKSHVGPILDYLYFMKAYSVRAEWASKWFAFRWDVVPIVTQAGLCNYLDLLLHAGIYRYEDWTLPDSDSFLDSWHGLVVKVMTAYPLTTAPSKATKPTLLHLWTHPLIVSTLVGRQGPSLMELILVKWPKMSAALALVVCCRAHPVATFADTIMKLESNVIFRVALALGLCRHTLEGTRMLSHPSQCWKRLTASPRSVPCAPPPSPLFWAESKLYKAHLDVIDRNANKFSLTTYTNMLRDSIPVKGQFPTALDSLPPPCKLPGSDVNMDWFAGKFTWLPPTWAEGEGEGEGEGEDAATAARKRVRTS